MQSIVMLHGVGNYAFDTKRDKEVEELVKLGYFNDRTDRRTTIDKNYSRDNLFKELSKRQYDIQPKSNTTKKEMLDWILENAEPLADKLARKYITISYSDSFMGNVRALKSLLENLDAKHPYRAERIYLVDFYNEMQEEKRKENQSVDDFVNSLTQRQQESTKSKAIALVMCIFGGYLGLHNFYAGKIGMGILYLCTLGLFGIGWVIDIIRIAGGKYTDRNGKYLK